jgi:hypothetical protein
MKRLRPRQNSAGEEVRKAINYFETNKERMRYSKVYLSVPGWSKLPARLSSGYD